MPQKHPGKSPEKICPEFHQVKRMTNAKWDVSMSWIESNVWLLLIVHVHMLSSVNAKNNKTSETLWIVCLSAIFYPERPNIVQQQFVKIPNSQDIIGAMYHNKNPLESLGKNMPVNHRSLVGKKKKTTYSRENYNITGNIMVGRLCSFLNGPFWGDMLISRGISTKPSPHTKKNPQRFRAQTRPVQNLKASTCSRGGGTRWFTFTLQKPMGEKRPETLLKHLKTSESW